MDDTPPESQAVPEALALAREAARVADNRKADHITLLDLRGLSSVTDFMLLMDAGSPPHLKALFSTIQQELKRKGSYCYRRSGSPEGGWLVLDYIDVVIHIQSPEARAYYGIESLWAAAPRLTL